MWAQTLSRCCRRSPNPVVRGTQALWPSDGYQDGSTCAPLLWKCNSAAFDMRFLSTDRRGSGSDYVSCRTRLRNLTKCWWFSTTRVRSNQRTCHLGGTVT